MLKSDLHIHTIMSGHGFCTFNECIDNAIKKNILVMGITDHGPSMEHAAHEGYFEMSKRIPKKIENTNILFGCEANIIEKNGSLDIGEKTIENLDIVIAGLHEMTPYSYHSESDNTIAIIQAMRNNKIHIISHPYRNNFPVSIKDIVSASVSEHILLEINKNLIVNAYFDNSNSISRTVIQKTAEMVDCLHSMDAPYIISSDAHHTSEIGINEHEYTLLTHCLGIDEKYVYNNNIDGLRRYIPSLCCCSKWDGAQ
jgi:putative hydrolase